MKKLKSILVAGGLLLPAVMLAQVQQPPPPVVSNFADLLDTVNLLTNWIFTIFLLIAIIIIIFAAFNYLTAGGDDEKIGTAKKQFIYAAVAIGVALVATSVKAIVTELLVV